MGKTGNKIVALARWLAARPIRYWLTALLLGVASFIGLVFSVNWKFGVALFGMVTILASDLFSLRLGILPVFFAIPMDRLGKLGPESIMTFAKLLIAVLIMAWGVRVVVSKNPRPLHILFHSPLFLIATLLLAFSFISVMNAHEYEIFLSQNLRRVNNFVLFVLITTIVDDQKLIRRALMVFLVAYFFVGLTVMFEIYSGESILKTVWGEADVALEYTLTSGSFRVGGPGGDPDFLAISVILPALVGVSMLLEPLSRLTRYFVLLVVMLMLASMLATGSRGGLLALMVGAGVFWLFAKMRYKYVIAGVALGLVVAMIVGLSLVGTASVDRYTGDSGGKSILYRFGWMEMAFQMIQDHPWVGIGTGNFPSTYSRYSPAIPTIPRSPYWTHNSFLQTWAENGIFAFILYALLFVTAAGAMLRVVLTTADPALRRLAVLLLSAVCAYFIFAGTSNVLENENYWIVFALVTVTAYLARGERRGRVDEPAALGRP